MELGHLPGLPSQGAEFSQDLMSRKGMPRISTSASKSCCRLDQMSGGIIAGKSDVPGCHSRGLERISQAVQAYWLTGGVHLGVRC